jgi:peptide/nickel transport system substrate-binding protein
VQNIPQKITAYLTALYRNFRHRAERYGKISQKSRRAGIEKKIILSLGKKKFFPRLGQFRYLGRFLSRKEKTALISFFLLAILSFGGLFVLFYFDATRAKPAFGGEYTEAIFGYPRFVNPLYSQTNEADKDLVALVYSGLMKRNARGVIVTDLAESYKTSDDEKMYIFTLKKNVLWHDGKTLTADDVLFTVNAIKDKNYNSPLRTTWENINVERVDDWTVRFRLEKPFGTFLSLATVGILPKHIWDKVPVGSVSRSDANSKPIGSGPYKFNVFTKDKNEVIKSYKLDANENYYDEKPFIEKITLKFFPDYASAVSALDNRQVDGLAVFASKEAKDALKLKSRLVFYDIYLPQYNAIFFNGNNNVLLKDKNIRRALSLAVDRKRIIKEAAGDEAVLMDGPIPKGYPGYTEKLKKLEFNSNEAQKILVDAGWVLKDGNKFRANKKNEKLKIVITTLESDQNIKAANVVKENWEAIGVATELKIMPAADIMKGAVENRNYEALLFGEKYGPDLDPYLYWHSSAQRYPGFNLSLYANRDVDLLLEQAHQTTDAAVRQKKYEDFQSLLVEDYPAVFLWQPQYSYIVDMKINGLQINSLATASDRWTNIQNCYINTRRVLK